MKLNRLTLEQALYLLALALAAGLRLAALNLSPLNDSEAALALQGVGLLQGSGGVLAPHPLYILGTTLFSFVFGANAFTARLLPALAGLALIGLPYLLRAQLGRRPALILAFLLALDPGLLGSSVQAGSALLGLACVLFALAGWMTDRPLLAGISAGLALLGGPGVWPGLLGLAVAWLGAYSRAGSVHIRFDWKRAGFAMLATALLGGTLLMAAPGGLNAAAAALPAYLAGWGGPAGISIGLTVAALLAYEILALLLGVFGALRGIAFERDGLDLFLSYWAAAALVLTLAYPARQVLDLVWVVFPLLVLAARQVERMLVISAEERGPMAAQAGLSLLLLLLLVNLAVSWPQNSAAAESADTYRWLVLGLAVVLLVAESLMVAWGWTRRIAGAGLAWGLTGLLLLYTLSAGVNVSGLSGRAAAELWRSGPGFSGARLLVKTITDYAQWTPRLDQTPEIVVTRLDSPAVRWALRDFANLTTEEVLPATAQPDFMLTAGEVSIEQAAAYTGQSFLLSEAPAWERIPPAGWINWLFFREIPAGGWQNTSLILWVRVDRFPGAAAETSQP